MRFTSSSPEQIHVRLAKMKLSMITRSLDETSFATKTDTGGTLRKGAVSGEL